MFRFIINGAGPVGSAIGGCLARAGYNVTLVARQPHVDAIHRQGGLLMETLGGELLQPIQAVTSLEDTILTENTIIFQTMKAGDFESSIDQMQGIFHHTPIVCWQNGFGCEDILRNDFDKVYGGVVRFTATQYSPGKTSFAGSGKLIMGPWPEGTDKATLQLTEILNHTPFTALASSSIRADKWLKVLVSLISCIKPITLKTAGEPERRSEFCRLVLKEGIDVLQAAGIRAASSNKTEDSPEEMLLHLEKTLKFAEGLGQNMDLKNSTWQSLARKKKDLEAEWYTGKIISLAQAFNTPVPYNLAVLDILRKMVDSGAEPESIPIEELWNAAEKNTRRK